MRTPQFILPLADELLVDLFAGGGGVSISIEQAVGRLANLRMWDAYGRRDAEIARRTHVALDAGRAAA